MKRILSMLLALCLIVGLLPAVAIPHAHAEDEVLTEAIRVMHDTTIYASTDGYSTYFVNQDIETTSSDNETFTGSTWAITGENRSKDGRTYTEPDVWNVKFEYPAGGIPTLYLKGARLDLLNETTGNYNASIKSTMYAIGGQSYESKTPLKIVILEDSYIATNSYVYNDSSNNTDLYIESRNGATLKTECRMGITVPNGDLIVDANLDMFMPKWAGDNCHLLCTNSADGDIVINGGNISLKSTLTDYTDGANYNSGTSGWQGPASIAMRTRGETADITINGGNLSIDTRYAVAVNTHGAIQTDGANAVITVNGGDVNIQSNNLGVIKSVQPIIINDGSFTGVAAKQFALLSATASKVIMKGGRLSLEGHGSAGNFSGQCTASAVACLDLTQYNGAYVLKYGKPADGAAVTEVNKTNLDGIYYRPYITVTPYCEDKGHTEVITTPGTATCTEPGLSDLVTCSVCGKVLQEQTEVPAGHKVVEVARVEPTTTAVGCTAGTKCARCGEILSGCEEIPMLKTVVIRIMSWNDMAADESGKVSYYKTYAQQGYNSAGEENGEYWTVKAGNANDWNIKFEYPLGGVPTLTFKDATLDHIGEDGTTIYKKNADGTFSSTGTLSAVLIKSGYMSDLKVILQGNNHFEVNNGIIRGLTSANQYFKNVTIVGENGGTMTGTGRGIGIAVTDGYDLTIENANIDIYNETSSGGEAVPFRVVGGDLTITNSTIKLRSTKNSVITAGGSGNITITDSDVTVDATFSGPSSAGAIQAYGVITINNSNIIGKSNGAIFNGFTGVEFNSGSLTADARYGLHAFKDKDTPAGYIKINGGEIEITAGDKACGVVPDLSGYEGWNAVAGTSKETAQVVTDTSDLTAKHVKISAEPIEIICEHTNTTTTEEIITEATCTAAGTKKVTVTCATCGEVVSEVVEETETIDHEWIDVEGKEPSCAEPGYTEGVKCASCGEWDTEPEEIAALGHTAGEAVKENETETSYESVIYCTVCKAEMSRETIVTACAHANTNTTEEVVKDATCTAAGTKKITVICADCGETVSETTEEIAMLGHTEEIIPGRAPTCTSNGRTDGKKCSVCGEILVAQEVIPAISHEFDENGNCVCGASQPAVTVVDENFQVEMNSFEYVKGYIFYIEKENAEGVDLTNWSAVMTASKVVTGSPFHETDNWKSFSKLINLSEYKLPNVTGTYVLFVEYLNNDGATKRVSASIDIVKKPKVTCGKDMFAIDMDGLTYKKGYIFYLENAEGADMSSWDALYAAAKVVPGSAFNATDEYKSFSNLNNLNNYLLPYVEGDYVLFVIYEDENGVEQNLARVIRMENLVEAEVTFNVDRFTIDTKGLKYYKSYFFYLESAEGVNLTNWSSVKKAAEAVPGSPYSLYEDWKTCHKQATLESTVLPNVNGVYVLFVDYWDVNGSIRQVTMTITVDDAVKPDITSGEGKIDIDMHGLEYQKAYVFYVESVKDLDTRKWSPVMTACRKVAGSPFSPTDNWKTFSKQTNLENYTLPEVTDAEGTYIIFLDYTDANGTTQQISAVINK